MVHLAYAREQHKIRIMLHACRQCQLLALLMQEAIVHVVHSIGEKTCGAFAHGNKNGRPNHERARMGQKPPTACRRHAYACVQLCVCCLLRMPRAPRRFLLYFCLPIQRLRNPSLTPSGRTPHRTARHRMLPTAPHFLTPPNPHRLPPHHQRRAMPPFTTPATIRSASSMLPLALSMLSMLLALLMLVITSFSRRLAAATSW